MKNQLFIFAVLVSLLFSCQFGVSATKNFITGISAVGNGLSCENIYLSTANSEKLDHKEFVFGEKFYINFENIKGFSKEGTTVFPGMELTIVSKIGDTVLYNQDLYAKNIDGFDIDPILLQGHITVGNPMHSNNDYSYHITIWDKKGSATLHSKGAFSVKANPAIEIATSGITYNDIYLFSERDKKVITDHVIHVDENVYLLFEGLNGFAEEKETLFLGLSINLTDASNQVLVEEADLVGDEPLSAVTVKDQLAPSFFVSSAEVVNPVTCTMEIWDKKTPRKIKVITQLKVQ